MTNDDIITTVLKYEGGFVNDLADRGGATNWGITQATLTAWRKRPATVADVKAALHAGVADWNRHPTPFLWGRPAKPRRQLKRNYVYRI